VGSTQEVFTLNVKAARLSRANLEEADLSRAKASGVDFRKANLRGAKLHFTQLDNANLSGADLTDADFSHANLKGAKLESCRLTRTILDGANLSGANLANTEGLKLETLQKAVGDHTTVLPEGMPIPDHWPADALNSLEPTDEWHESRIGPETYKPAQEPDN